MDATKLVTHRVSGDVLLGPLLQSAGLPHGLLARGLIGLLEATDAEVHAGAHLLDLHAGEPLPAALGADEVGAQVDGGLRVALSRRLLGGDGDDVLQALDVDLVRGLALEEVDEEALGLRELVGDGALEGGAREEEHGPQPHGELLGLELGQPAERLRVEVELEHVEDLEGEGSDEGQGVRALLAAGAEDEQAGVVLLGEELERGRVLEGVDGVLLGELLGQGLAHGVKLRQGILRHLGAGRSPEEEAALWVLDGLGFALLESPLGAGIARFAGRKILAYRACGNVG